MKIDINGGTIKIFADDADEQIDVNGVRVHPADDAPPLSETIAVGDVVLLCVPEEPDAVTFVGDDEFSVSWTNKDGHRGCSILSLVALDRPDVKLISRAADRTLAEILGPRKALEFEIGGVVEQKPLDFFEIVDV